MKKLILSISLIVLAFGCTALAENAYMDNVGVYFDPEGTDLCMSRIDEIAVHHVYVVLNKMTHFGAKGFEMTLISDGPLAFSNYTFPAGSGALNLMAAPSFMVGFATPQMAVDGAVVLMEFDILVYSLLPVDWDQTQDANVYIKEVFFHSLPDAVPAYLDELGEIRAMHQSTGTALDPVLIFSLDASGCGNIIANDETTWDALKSLYR